ncbi:unnamed protein product [Rodentolepis nana]|uniref:F-box domain-containing protein n=1 Tax=Rodentolepis nana TaxID=102285 RepID=A0A0R3TDG4_RODNA|nr:unnamed protein product [Rodentolepis nana]
MRFCKCATIVCTEWYDLAERCNHWEEARRSSNISKCWYFDHTDLDQSAQWTALCADHTHMWKNAIYREMAVGYKCRSSDLEVVKIVSVSDAELDKQIRVRISYAFIIISKISHDIF